MTEIKELIATIAAVKQLKDIVLKQDQALQTIQVELRRIDERLQRLEDKATPIGS